MQLQQKLRKRKYKRKQYMVNINYIIKL